MKSRKNKRFKKLFAALPASVQRQASKTYKLFSTDPYHNSLHFKVVNEKGKLYSIRIGNSYRALGVMDDEHNITWIWIGSHADYDTLLNSL